MSDITRPIYSININVNNCNAVVWCNDIILFEHKPLSTKSQGMAITLPINQLLLKQGEFEIRAEIGPSFRTDTLSESSFVQLQLFVKSNNTNKSIRLLNLKTPDHTDARDKEKSSNLKDIGTLEGLQSYRLLGVYKDKILPFEVVGWSKSVNLLDQTPQSLLTKGFEFLKKIETIINNKGVSQFIELNEDKNKLLKETLYLSNREAEKCKINDIMLLIEDGYNMVPVDFSKIEYVLMGKGRLIKLRRKNGLSSIILNNPKKGLTAEFDIKLHKKTPTSGFSII